MPGPYAVRVKTPDGWQDIALLGQTGPAGPTGPGVPVGGTTGQVLAKKSATDLDTQWVTGGGSGGGGHVVQDEGNALSQRTKLDFQGTGVTVTDDPTNDKSIVTVPGISAITLDTWHTVGAASEPPFMGTWAAFGSGYQVPQFRKDPMGKVWIRGLAKSGAIGTAIFTLPAGYRPPAETGWNPVTNNGSTNVQGEIRVQPNGQVVVINANVSAGYTFIDGAFDTDTVTAMPAGPQGPKGDPGNSATVPMDAWHNIGAAGEPAFQNGWTTLSGYGVVGFRKDPLGRVFLRGTIQSGPNQTVAFTLPVGYRPTATARFITISNQQAVGQWEGQVNVGADGTVFVYMSNAAGLISLDQIDFDSGLVTAMPTGPQGPKGDTGAAAAPIAAVAYRYDCQSASAVAFTALPANGSNAFTQIPIPSSATLTTIDPAGSFTRNADGSVSPTDAGWYQTEVEVQFSTNSAMRCYINLDDQAGGAIGSITPWAYVGSQGSIYPNLQASAAVYLTAGQKVYVNATSEAANQAGIERFTIYRIGGTQGPAGPTGGNATVPIDPWHIVGAAGEPAFQNSWANTGSTSKLKFRKDPLGRVWIQGSVTTGSSGTSAFTLPAGYRPKEQFVTHSLQDNDIAGTWVYVNTDGTVVLARNQTSCYLDLSFDTETVTAMPTGPQGPKGDTGGNATVPMDTWHVIGAAGEPAFGAGFAVVAGWATPAFRKDPLGRVHLRGTLNGFNASIPVFTLPIGYRPPAALIFDAIGGNNQQCRVNIAVNGAVTCTVGEATYLSLDGMSFDTESVTVMPTGPQGSPGVGGARMWCATENVIRNSSSGAYVEISTSLRVTPKHTAGTYVRLSFCGQWEHNTLAGYMAVQWYDLDAGAYLPGYYIVRARAASENTTFNFEGVLTAAQVPTGHRITPYWSTGSGIVYLRADAALTFFSISEFAVGT